MQTPFLTLHLCFPPLPPYLTIFVPLSRTSGKESEREFFFYPDESFPKQRIYADGRKENFGKVRDNFKTSSHRINLRISNLSSGSDRRVGSVTILF